MAHAHLTAALMALGLSGAQLSATAPANVTLAPSGGFAVITPLALPSIVISPDSSQATFATETPAAGTGSGVISGNARLTVRSDTGEAVSLDVPPSFAVVRSGGDEALTVNTVTNGDLSVVGDGVLLNGSIMGGSATSVDIGGELALASTDHLVPGPYNGLFVVVVQYN